MFGGFQFGQPYFGQGPGTYVTTIVIAPGLEYVVVENRLHYRANVNKPHFVTTENRLHFVSIEEDLVRGDS